MFLEVDRGSVRHVYDTGSQSGVYVPPVVHLYSSGIHWIQESNHKCTLIILGYTGYRTNKDWEPLVHEAKRKKGQWVKEEIMDLK